MARSRISWRQPLLLLIVALTFLSPLVVPEKEATESALDVARMSIPDIEEALQQCPLVQDLNRHRKASNPPTSGLTEQVFSFLFPGTPAVNALLATLYISGPPNFLLALCPPNIDPSSLSVMVAFAVGGLLGDTVFHLLPEIFLGEASPDEARFVLVAPNKNLLLGVAILVGFVTFVAMDKGLRIATGGDGGHDHSHGKEKGSLKEEADVPAIAETSGASPETSPSGLKLRREYYTKSPKVVKICSVHDDLLEEIQSYDEPKRSKLWLRAVLEVDAESDVTQMVLWQAYQVQLKNPHLPAAHFIRNFSSIFDGAEAQTVPTDDGQGGTTNKYIIKGIRPRSQALTLADFKGRLSTRKQTPSPPPAYAATSTDSPSPSSSIRLSAYLNLIADFTHNITDGLALSSSFYASPTLGATTTAAVFFHEIPHEVGDFALLIQSGFGKKRAMAAQFVTALGAFLGTALGIAVQELSKFPAQGGNANGAAAAVVTPYRGLAGTGLGWGDLLLPFTAGTFLYVGTVAVIPELLVTGADRAAEVRKTAWQFAAMALGAGIMLA